MLELSLFLISKLTRNHCEPGHASQIEGYRSDHNTIVFDLLRLSREIVHLSETTASGEHFAILTS